MILTNYYGRGNNEERSNMGEAMYDLLFIIGVVSDGILSLSVMLIAIRYITK